MSRTSRFVTASVDVSICDFCGAEEFTGAAVHGRRTALFDPRSRSGGFLDVPVWPNHPYFGKDICSSCQEADKHLIPELAAPPKMVRVRAYSISTCRACDGRGCTAHGCQAGKRYGDNGQGLQLPEAPSSEKMHYGMVRSGENAVLFRKVSGYWLPSLCASELLYDLGGHGAIFLCEDSPETPWRTVLHAVELRRWENENFDLDALRERYGSDVAERVDDGNGKLLRYFMQVKLRTPWEILR